MCTITPPNEFLRTPQPPRGAHESRRRAAGVRIRRDSPSFFPAFHRNGCPEHGYYRRPRQHFVNSAVTAKQITHSLGGLLAAARPMALEHDEVPGGCDRGRVSEASHREMAEPIFAWRHVPVKPHPRARPEPFRPLAFSTSDALAGRRCVFQRSSSAGNASPSNGTDSLEQPPIWGLAARPVSGPLLPSPGQHPAQEEILDHLGWQHITAHVNFTLEEHGTRYGFGAERIETQTLLAAGFEEQFGAASAWGGRASQGGRRLQPKTLRYSIGEAFRVLRQRRMLTGKRRRKPETAKRPRKPGPLK